MGKGVETRKGVEREWIVLASCMHAGSRIVKVRQCLDQGFEDEDGDDGDGDGNGDEVGRWEIDVLAKFEEHASMNYGSDVQPSFSSTESDDADGTGMRTRTRTVVSTSFYDRLMCLWRFRDESGKP